MGLDLDGGDVPYRAACGWWSHLKSLIACVGITAPRWLCPIATSVIIAMGLCHD